MSALGRGLARVVLKIGGWRVEGDRPAASSYVLIAAPHTSNWDFIWFIAMALFKDVPVRWLGKHTLFRGPLGYLMRALGGLPIERSSQQGYVAQIAGLFCTPEPVVLVFPAEGTRGPRTALEVGLLPRGAPGRGPRGARVSRLRQEVRRLRAGENDDRQSRRGYGPPAGILSRHHRKTSGKAGADPAAGRRRFAAVRGICLSRSTAAWLPLRPVSPGLPIQLPRVNSQITHTREATNASERSVARSAR